MTLNGVMAVNLCYFTEVGKPAFQQITISARIKLIDQMSASITRRAVKFACVIKYAFASGHVATGKSRTSALLAFNLSFKFRFTVAFFALMLGFRLIFLPFRAISCRLITDIYWVFSLYI